MSDKMKQVTWALLSFLVYVMVFNWKIGLLLTVAVAFHEYSHLWAARRLGLQTKGFYLVPFMGGVAFISEKYKSFGQQAFVALMGPIGGGTLAGATTIVYYLSGYEWLGQAAQWMAWLNLFNLLPLSFLDGGQVMKTITYSINRTLGVACLTISTLAAIFILFKFNPTLSFLVLIFGGLETFKEIKDWFNYQKDNIHLVSADFLLKPKSLTKIQMAITVIVYVLTLLSLYKLVVILPKEGISYFLPT